MQATERIVTVKDWTTECDYCHRTIGPAKSEKHAKALLLQHKMSEHLDKAVVLPSGGIRFPEVKAK